MTDARLRTLPGGLLNRLELTEALSVPAADLQVALEDTVRKAKDRGWLDAR